MQLDHPRFINVPTVAILMLGTLFIIRQRHYALQVGKQQRINEANLAEAVLLVNF